MKIQLLLVSMILSMVAFGQTKECDQFREGYFKIEDSITGLSLLHRVGTKQKEYNSISKMKLELSVEWSECGYKLLLEKVLNNPYRIEIDTSFSIDIAIIETKNDSYLQRSTSPNSDMIIETDVHRITEKEYNEILEQQNTFDKDFSIHDPVFKKKVAQSICTCFSETSETKISQSFFANCIANSLLEYKEEIIYVAMQDSTGTDHKKLGEQLGEELVLTVQKDLIHDCDNYFHFLDELKKTGEENRYAKASQKITDSLSLLIEEKQELVLYRKRAGNYLGLKDYKNAEKDIDICFFFDPSDLESKMLYALILEGKEEYLKAADLYLEISEITGNKFLPIIAELAKRKAKAKE